MKGVEQYLLWIIHGSTSLEAHKRTPTSSPWPHKIIMHKRHWTPWVATPTLLRMMLRLLHLHLMLLRLHKLLLLLLHMMRNMLRRGLSKLLILSWSRRLRNVPRRWRARRARRLWRDRSIRGGTRYTPARAWRPHLLLLWLLNMLRTHSSSIGMPWLMHWLHPGRVLRTHAPVLGLMGGAAHRSRIVRLTRIALSDHHLSWTKIRLSLALHWHPWSHFFARSSGGSDKSAAGVGHGWAHTLHHTGLG